ncbi:SMC-Scp complex subunit ScpB [Pseudoglutamicibacter albus]|uniref:SMC-Scp complex subunit ScpB n=1 Tax=Pseudoglutamicibacter albus TaxID=98671 RepID=UPI000C766F7F|nr:SMC-Scp complex subunit ScpB [Pseudoglutamicibacter albus]PKY80440.1 segregation and condensation protein B [Pseudoglutamicibacter albus]WIK84650.1 SMC-Scp complex subunit ScpB [Pseudoglutamicibacter albus]
MSEETGNIEASRNGEAPGNFEKADTADDAQVREGLEAVLMVADRPLTETELADLFEVDVVVISRVLHELAAEYDGKPRSTGHSDIGQTNTDHANTGAGDTDQGFSVRRGFQLRRVGGGWRIGARQEHRELVSRFVLEGQTAKLSAAAMETLAIITYRQPVSRARIASIRGVNADGVVRTLMTRGLIEQVATEEVTGAGLFGTTPVLLERLGVDSLEELPDLSPLLPGVENLDDVLPSL